MLVICYYFYYFSSDLQKTAAQLLISSKVNIWVILIRIHQYEDVDLLPLISLLGTHEGVKLPMCPATVDLPFYTRSL